MKPRLAKPKKVMNTRARAPVDKVIDSLPAQGSGTQDFFRAAVAAKNEQRAANLAVAVGRQAEPQQGPEKRSLEGEKEDLQAKRKRIED
jgi:hypothetical protein